MARASKTRRPSKKLFYKIGEVCELTDTEPYVLRYWESEFPFLAPEKNKAGQRIYSEQDIETVHAIKRLLYEEGYTTAGARRRLEKELEAPSQAPAEDAAANAGDAGEAGELRAALRDVRDGLREVRDLLARGSESRSAAGSASRGSGSTAKKTTAPSKKAAATKRTSKKAAGRASAARTPKRGSRRKR